MKKILIGEDHENPIARELILKLINKIGQRKVQFMIEFELADYQIFVQDVKENRIDRSKFNPLSEIVNMALSNNNITIMPIDIPWDLLLEGMRQMIKNKKASTSESFLNQLLSENWEGTSGIKSVADMAITLYDGKPISLLDLLKNDSIKLSEIIKFNKDKEGKLRKDFYQKPVLKILRDKYFIDKIKNIEGSKEFLIVLVGNLHYPNLCEWMKTSNDFYPICKPTNGDIENFMQKIFTSDEKTEKQSAPTNTASNSAFYQAQSDNNRVQHTPAAAPPFLSAKPQP